MTSSPLVPELLERWSSLGIDPRLLKVDQTGTLVSAGRDRAPEIPDLRGVMSRPSVSDELVLGDVMAVEASTVVRRAFQRSLRRDVAVVVAQEGSDDADDEVIREGRVLARLEHPNLVPVHLLGEGADGRPMLATRMVQGRAWSTFMGGRRGQLSAPVGIDEPLEWHIRVLMTVCQVLHYAHSLGVVHRDVKPESVIIGEFDEIYLVQWGLAVSLDPLVAPELPIATGVTRLVGTPSRMPPEMVLVDGDRVGPWTDVYLLGTCLHTIMTGLPRHTGRDILAQLYSAATSEPVEYPELYPQELSRIANFAMAAEPIARFRDAEAMREALASYLAHRASERLSQEAWRRIPDLEAAVGAETAAARRRLLDHLGACRYGFQHALADWPENNHAALGLRRVAIAEARHEIESGKPTSAARLLGSIERPPKDLLTQIEWLRQRQAQEAAELQALEEIEEDMDVRVGLNVRSRIMTTLGVSWGSLFALLAVLHHAGIFSAGYTHYTVLIMVHASVIGVFGFRHREVLEANSVNQRFLMCLLFSVLFMVLVWPTLMYTNTPFHYGLGLLMWIVGFCCSMAAVAIDPRLLVSGAILTAGLFSTVLWPWLAHTALAVTIGVGLTYVGWVWSKEPPDPTDEALAGFRGFGSDDQTHMGGM